MTVTDHHTAAVLETAARKASGRLQGRIWAILWAKEGLSGSTIGTRLHCTDRAVRFWVARYNASGLAGLGDRPRSGHPAKLTPEQEAAFRARVIAGPRPTDGVSVLHGDDFRRILAAEFGVEYTAAGARFLAHRLGLTPLMPRPVHPKNDPEAMERWVAEFPLLSSRSHARIRKSE